MNLRLITFGFPKLFEVIELLENENYEKKYVGIVDADFRHLDNEIPKSDAIFLTDEHDLANILAMLFMKAIANYDSKAIFSQEIESKLVAYYDSSDLQNTELYHSLKQWETTHNSYKLLTI